MVKPQFQPHVKEMLGEDFSQLLYELAPFVEPRMDITESNQHFTIYMELLGAITEDFSIKWTNHTLIIEGVIPKIQLENGRVISSERFYGPFRRMISIPKECNLEQLIDFL